MRRPSALGARRAAPKAARPRDSSLGQILSRNRMLRVFLFPENRQHFPVAADAHELKTVDAAREGLFIRGCVPRLVCREDVSDVGENIDMCVDRMFEETMLVEVRR